MRLGHGSAPCVARLVIMSDLNAILGQLQATIDSAAFEAGFAETCSDGARDITLFNCRDHLQRSIFLVEEAQDAVDRAREAGA